VFALLHKVLKAAGALLVLFHVWLFARDAWAGHLLLDLGLLARWGAAAALVWGLWRLRRRGESMLVGRRAVAMWTLAALLHGPALAGRFEIPDLPLTPVVAGSLASAAAGVTAAGLLLLLAWVAARRRRLGTPLVAHTPFHHACLGPLAPGSYLPFAQRPPPLA
jgi:hypothetical protein